MALAKQIEQFRVVTNGNTYDLNIQNMSLDWDVETFSNAQTSLSGKRLVSRNFAGKRPKIEVDYEQNIEPSTFNNMIDDILIDFIYNNAESIKFYPDASSTGQLSLVTATANASVTTSNTINFSSSHGLLDGQFIEVISTDIAGLSTGEYFVKVIDSDSIQLSPLINGTIESGLTNAAAIKSISIVENRYINVYPTNLKQLQEYRNTISLYVPSISLEGITRYVTTPTVFRNV